MSGYSSTLGVRVRKLELASGGGIRTSMPAGLLPATSRTKSGRLRSLFGSLNDSLLDFSALERKQSGRV